MSSIDNSPDKEWIGVDLDGTLAVYHKGSGPADIGAPIAPMVARVKHWLAAGEDVRILTARVAPNSWANEQERLLAYYAIKHWCVVNLGRELPVTAYKDQYLRELWDDRARQVEFNTGKLPAYSDLTCPYCQKHL